MSTIVAFSSKQHGATEHAEFLVNPAMDEWPQHKPFDALTLAQGRPSLVVLPRPKADPNRVCASAQTTKRSIWDWLELGLTALLGLSVLGSILLFLGSAANT
jgi:hypothetical protein